MCPVGDCKHAPFKLRNTLNRHLRMTHNIHVSSIWFVWCESYSNFSGWMSSFEKDVECSRRDATRRGAKRSWIRKSHRQGLHSQSRMPWIHTISPQIWEIKSIMCSTLFSLYNILWVLSTFIHPFTRKVTCSFHNETVKNLTWNKEIENSSRIYALQRV